MLDAGATIGDYRLEERIGRGGMGVVFRATQLSLGRPVALKLIAPELAEDPLFRERFKREARLAARIDHPNVVPVHQADEVDGQLYIAMRYVPGTDLRAYLTERGRLDPSDAVRILEQVAAALDAAHEQELVHRDVKPANVLLSGKKGAEHAYLTDFGLTKNVSSSVAMTRTGAFVGTLDYVAPEQLKGLQVDGRADVYALGCVLFELLTGSVPFERDSDVAKIYAHTALPPPRPSEVVATLPAAFDAVVGRAMEKDRDARYDTAGELAAAARAVLAGEPVATPTLVPADRARTEVLRSPPPKPNAAPESEPEPEPEPAGAAIQEPRRGRIDRRAGALVAVCGAGAIAAAIGFASGGPSGADANAAYQQAIGTVCEAYNEHQESRVARLAPFEHKLERLRTLDLKRDHIIDENQLRLNASADLRTRLAAAPTPPAGSAGEQARTLRAWDRNLERQQRHRDALEHVRTYRGLDRVLDRIPRLAIQDDARSVITGLRRLGGARCDLDTLVPDPVIRIALPGGKASQNVLRNPPGAAPGGSGGGGGAVKPPALSPPADPAPDETGPVLPPAPQVLPPPDQAVPSPPPPVLPPPSAGGGGG